MTAAIAMRSTIKPMLASPAGELPSLAGWAIEPKWDGIRVIAELTARRAHLWSRNGIDKAQGFGKIGTGYTRATLEMLGTKLGRLRAKASPFLTVPRAREMSEWVKPVLVAQVRYNEMTANGMLRQPVFLGLRDDKKAADVRLEAATTESAILAGLRCTPGTARSYPHANVREAFLL